MARERFVVNGQDAEGTGYFEDGEWVGSSSRRSPGSWEKPGKRFRRSKHKVDDSMFTSYRIDRFPQPFGGFVFAGAEQKLIGKAADAPVVRVKRMPKEDAQARTAPT
jgi:hypothetical protein